MGLFYDMDEITSIKKIEEIRKKKIELSEQESLLVFCRLTDFSHIKKIYDWFNLVIDEDLNQGTKMQVFIFIVKMLYAPTGLIGDKMPNKLRHSISEVSQKKGQIISQYSSDLMFYYENYKDFREMVNRVYNEIQFCINLYRFE